MGPTVKTMEDIEMAGVCQDEAINVCMSVSVCVRVCVCVRVYVCVCTRGFEGVCSVISV